MAWVRGQERLVYERVYRQVKDKMLTALGWDGTALAGGALPWGATVAPTFTDLPPDPKTGPMAPNTIAVSEGSTPDDADLELGEMLKETRHTVFIDIFGESVSVARALASDVRSILTGRAPGCSRYLSLPDYAGSGTDLPGHLIHFENVVIDFPTGLGQHEWVIVKAEAVHEWNV